MKNWKTTLAACIAACGTGLTTIKDPAWVGYAGQLLQGIGTFLIGLWAKDAAKTDTTAK